LPETCQQRDWYWAEALKENKKNKAPKPPKGAVRANLLNTDNITIRIASVLSCIFFTFVKLRNDVLWLPETCGELIDMLIFDETDGTIYQKYKSVSE